MTMSTEYVQIYLMYFKALKFERHDVKLSITLNGEMGPSSVFLLEMCFFIQNVLLKNSL